MTRLVARRLLALPLILLSVATIYYVLVWASPFDPSEAYLRAYSPEVVTVELREQYIRAWGLDRSLPEQWVRWLGHVVQGDLGVSRLLAGQPVAEALASRAAPSLILIGTALGLVLVGGLGAGVLAAAFRDSWFDWLVRTFSYAAVFAPAFWIALLLIYLFAVQLGWLPAAGAADFRAAAGGGLRIDVKYLILPAFTLALGGHGWYTLYVRNTLLEVMREDYVRFARAHGLSRAAVLFRHVLPNALIPFVTLIGVHIPELIGGDVLIESIFGWPGLGDLTRLAGMAVDLPLLLGITLVGAVLVVLGNLTADLLYRVIDPRIREALR